MCRNIRTLFNFDPPATEEEIRAASVQFVRKLSGCTRPSRVNQEAFDRAVDDVSAAAGRLLSALVTQAPPRDRARAAAQAKERAAGRYGRAEPMKCDAPAARGYNRGHGATPQRT